MKKRFYLIFLLIAVVALSSAAVFADTDGNPVKQWDSNWETYYDAGGNPSVGLFKAPKYADPSINTLYFADSNGKVVKKTGPVTVTEGPFYRYKETSTSSGYSVDSSAKGPLTYFVYTADGDFDIMPHEGIYSAAGKKYYVRPDGTVKTNAGVITFEGNRYYVREGGAIKTTIGWADTSKYRYFVKDTTGKLRNKEGFFTYKDKKWYTNSNGVVRSKKGLFTYGSSRYYSKKDGSIRTKEGFIRVNGRKYLVRDGGKIRKKAGKFKYNGRYYVAKDGGAIITKKGFVKPGKYLYYVKNSYGVLAVNKTLKVNDKKYHIRPTGSVAVGVHKWKGVRYCSDDKGALFSKKAVVRSGSNYYFVNADGKIALDQKIKFKNKYYIASKKGAFYTGLFTWKKSMYYANSKGVLRVNRGLFAYDGKKYCTHRGGKIYRNRTFQTGGKKYSAGADGAILIGYYKINGKYYLTDRQGAIITKQGIYEYKGERYYVKSGGSIPVNSFITFKERYYYAGSTGALVRKQFRYDGYTLDPNSKTGEISLEDYAQVFPEAAPKETEDPETVEGDGAVAVEEEENAA